MNDSGGSTSHRGCGTMGVIQLPSLKAVPSRIASPPRSFPHGIGGRKCRGGRSDLRAVRGDRSAPGRRGTRLDAAASGCHAHSTGSVRTSRNRSNSAIQNSTGSRVRACCRGSAARIDSTSRFRLVPSSVTSADRISSGIPCGLAPPRVSVSVASIADCCFACSPNH